MKWIIGILLLVLVSVAASETVYDVPEQADVTIHNGEPAPVHIIILKRGKHEQLFSGYIGLKMNRPEEMQLPFGNHIMIVDSWKGDTWVQEVILHPSMMMTSWGGYYNRIHIWVKK